MEENRFSARVVPEKKYFKDFGRIHMKKSKSSLVLLIMALVFFAITLAITYLDGIGSTSYALTAAYMLFFWWLFFGDFMGRAAYRSLYKKQQGLPQTYYFGEMGLSTYTELESSSVNYQAIGDVYENGRIFALYNSKNTAFVIPKSSFTEGTPAQFRQFIGEKTGKKVKRVRTYDRTALKIVAAVLSFLLMLGVWILADWLHEQKAAVPQTFTVDNYSITLPGDFKEDTIEDCDLAVFTDTVGVLVYRFDAEERTDLFGQAESVHGYMLNYAVNIGLSADDMWLEGGAAYLEYISTVDGEDWYCLDVLHLRGDTLYLTEFFCPDEESDAHLDDLATWEKSITIK